MAEDKVVIDQSEEEKSNPEVWIRFSLHLLARFFLYFMREQVKKTHFCVVRLLNLFLIKDTKDENKDQKDGSEKKGKAEDQGEVVDARVNIAKPDSDSGNAKEKLSEVSKVKAEEKSKVDKKPDEKPQKPALKRNFDVAFLTGGDSSASSKNVEGKRTASQIGNQPNLQASPSIKTPSFEPDPVRSAFSRYTKSLSSSSSSLR